MSESEKKLEEKVTEDHTTPQIPSSSKEGRLNPPPSAPPLGKEESRLPNFNAWQMAWELGYTISIPIVLLALLGRWADKQFETSPWLLLVGIVVSIFISSAMVYRKVKKIL